MKNFFFIIIFFFILWFNIIWAQASDIKVRFYGHVYLEDRNNPLNNIKVYVIKNGVIIWESKSNKEGVFDFVIDNREDYLNLCIQSTEFSQNKNIDFCETISIFQKAGRNINWVEVREVEYTFVTNSKWENLNQRLENEISNIATESAFNEYELIKWGIQQEKENKEAEEIKLKELEEKKAQYKMVNNTEMIGPLNNIQIIGTVIDKDKKMDIKRTYIRVVDHLWNTLEDKLLWDFQDFNLNISAGEWKVFLHPLNLIIYNNQRQDIKWEKFPLFQTEYRLVTKEKNIFNIELKPYKYNEFKDKYVIQREKFPFLWIILIVWLLLSTLVLIIKNKNHNIRNS